MLDLQNILLKHKKWVDGFEDGIRADLSGADLYGADLSGADLSGADLSGANLSGAKNTNSVLWSIYTSFYPLQCPETGSFVGYKKAGNIIIKLEICEDALRSSATSRKCRCSKAKVISFETLDGEPVDLLKVKSDYDSSFVYKIGETVEVDDFDGDRWHECAAGIHFFSYQG